MPDVKYYYSYDTTNAWIIMYHLMKRAHEDAKKILLVNEIESTRQYKSTTGLIKIGQSDDIEIKSFYVLPLKAMKKLEKEHKIISNIEISYKKKYKLKLEVDDKYTQSISYQEALNILTLVLYDKYVNYNPDVIWQDSNENEFYYDDDFRGAANENGLLKHMIYETLVTLEKKQMLYI